MFRGLISLAAAVLSLSGMASAATILGPIQDFRGTVDPSPSASLRSTGGSHNGWDLKDSVKMFDGGSTSFNLRGVAYLSSPTPDFTGDLTFVTIYGLDPDPNLAALSVFAIDPAAPLSIFDERIVGNSGTEYQASLSFRATLSTLSNLYPDFDLSVLHGSPTDTFFVFSTPGPGADFTVPEPSAFVLGALGSAALCVALRRRK